MSFYQVEFLAGKSHTFLEDCCVWQTRPKHGTTFYQVLRKDEYFLGVDVAIGEHSILALRFVVKCPTGLERTSMWYGEPDGENIQVLFSNFDSQESCNWY